MVPAFHPNPLKWRYYTRFHMFNSTVDWLDKSQSDELICTHSLHGHLCSDEHLPRIISPAPILLTLFTLTSAPWSPPHPSITTCSKWHLHSSLRISHLPDFCNSIQSQNHGGHPPFLFTGLVNWVSPSIPQIILKPLPSSPSTATTEPSFCTTWTPPLTSPEWFPCIQLCS